MFEASKTPATFSTVEELIQAATQRGSKDVKLVLPIEVRNHPDILRYTMRLLACFLKDSRCMVEMLDISGNNIGLIGTKDIREALPFNQTLRRLDISRNQLGSEEVGLIADSLSGPMGNQTLTDLHIAGNIASDADNKAYAEAMLAQMLKTHRLEALNIQDTTLGNYDLLVAAVKENTSICTLVIDDENFSPEDIAILNSHIEANQRNKPKFVKLVKRSKSAHHHSRNKGGATPSPTR